MKPVNNFKLNRERTVDLKKFGSKSTEFRYSHKEMLIVYIKNGHARVRLKSRKIRTLIESDACGSDKSDKPEIRKVTRACQ